MVVGGSTEAFRQKMRAQKICIRKIFKLDKWTREDSNQADNWSVSDKEDIKALKLELIFQEEDEDLDMC